MLGQCIKIQYKRLAGERESIKEEKRQKENGTLLLLGKALGGDIQDKKKPIMYANIGERQKDMLEGKVKNKKKEEKKHPSFIVDWCELGRQEKGQYTDR